MTGYYRAKRELEREEAKRYLAEREAADRIRPVNERLQRSRAWLDKYLAPGRQRPTAFNWAPRWPIKPPEDDNGQEIIEGDYTIVADADATGKDARIERAIDDGGVEAQAGGRHSQGNAQQGEGDFTSQDRTPF